MSNIDNKHTKEIPLQLVDPDWGSSLASTIIELEKLRVKKLGGPVPPYIFFQIKDIFQKFESLGSARIEGNNTTLAEFVEKIIEKTSSSKKKDEGLEEILNIDKAIDFIDKNIKKDSTFTRALLSQIHKILMNGLTPPPDGEGSRYPGELRPVDVTIAGSKHIPPNHLVMPDYFEELLDFVNQSIDAQYHLLVVALAHHRMTWVHPYDNGNGRMVRMFTYALLIKQGFQVKSGRIVNPTAIFCMDRDKYYDMLSLADTGEKEKTLQWCSYVLGGLKEEIEKIDRLLDLKYMTDIILLPVLSYALEREHVTKREYEILKLVVKDPGMCIKASDLDSILGKDIPAQRSRILRRLKEKKILKPLAQGGRIYTISFNNNFLLRGVVHVLEINGFVPSSLNEK
jgi:Fic family protein